jgi:hypothetical protein
MDSSYDILKSYDDPMINGIKRKDHGTLSQRAAVTLLIYLAFGIDYSGGIAKYFRESYDKNHLGENFPHVLTQSNKLSSVIKKK